MFDVLIIGGGASGISSALILGSAKNKPFVINLLCAHSLPTPKPTLNDLIQLNIFSDPMNIPKGIVKLNNKQFIDLINFAYSRNRE